MSVYTNINRIQEYMLLVAIEFYFPQNHKRGIGAKLTQNKGCVSRLQPSRNTFFIIKKEIFGAENE